MPDYLKVVLHRICLLAIWPGVAVAALPSVVERTYVETPEAVLAYWTDEKLRAVEDKGEVPLKPPSADPLNSDGDAWEGTGRFPAGVGRLFSISPSAKDVSCTATAVDSPAGNVLVTAFHCVSQLDEDGNPVWNSYLMFVPGFVDGVAPQGRYPVGRMVAPVGVLETGDIAFLRVHPRADGRSVAEMAGTQAIRFDIPASASPRIDFGYPVSANGYGILPPPAPLNSAIPSTAGNDWPTAPPSAQCWTRARTSRLSLLDGASSVYRALDPAAVHHWSSSISTPGEGQSPASTHMG